MASMNHKLDDEIETLFMMTNNDYAYLRSSAVKESQTRRCTKGLVPDIVVQKLKRKFQI